MTTVYIDCTKDSWYVLYDGSSKYGNGLGPRLQSGYNVDGTGHTWQHRFGLGFHENGVIPAGATIVSATARLTVRGTHSCFAQGASPKMYVERVANADYTLTDNAETAECVVGSGGNVDDHRWGGPPVTTTHQVAWSGSPSTGDVVSIDVTNQFVDWLAAKTTGTYFCVVARAQTDGVSNQKIAFDSYEIAGSCIHSGGTAADLVVVYTTNSPPVVTNTNRTPINGSRQVALGTREFQCAYSDPDAADMTAGPAQVQLQVDDDSGFGSPLSNTTAAPDAYAGNIWHRTITLTEVEGTTYYWRYKVQDQAGAWSGWSTTYSYVMNRSPIASLTSPS